MILFFMFFLILMPSIIGILLISDLKYKDDLDKLKQQDIQMRIKFIKNSFKVKEK